MKLRARTIVAAASVLSLLAVGSAVAVLRAAGGKTQARDFYISDPALGEEGWTLREAREYSRQGADEDDPRWRAILHRVLYGRPSSATRAQWMRVAEREAARWAGSFPRRGSTAVSYSMAPMAAPAGAAGETWINLGPADAAFEYNDSVYYQVDSGRLTGVVVDPANPATVYVSTSGGGIWKAADFGVAADPTWVPVSDSIGNQAIGALAIDPNNGQVLYAGTGDAFDTEGGAMLKTADGGASWLPAVPLVAADPSNGGITHGVRSIRQIVVDPGDSSHVLVATDLGLFQSRDGGATYAFTDLPNGSYALYEATWTIAYLGRGTASAFAVSGVDACSPGMLPPAAGGGLTPGAPIPGTSPAQICTLGNPGEVWTSTDGGATWQSRRPALPTAAGRMTLAAVPNGNPAAAVLYALAATEDETAQAGLWRSNDGGATFTALGGTLANITGDCRNTSVTADQAWYNQALAVDPGDANHVLVGGQLCGMRTLNGLSSAPTWENVAHWLPTSSGGSTSTGPLPYVHADWHRLLVVRAGGVVRAFGGTDGGLFYADDAFTAAPTSVGWRHANRGLVTHLAYSIASGDPALGDPFTAFTGLQDNGTRLRESEAAPTTFNQVVGGDGFGTAEYRDYSGNTLYLASVTGGDRVACSPSASNNFCAQGGVWTDSGIGKACASDLSGLGGFWIYYATTARQDGPAILTATDRAVFKLISTSPLKWVAASGCFKSSERDHSVRYLSASPVQDGVFGAALSGGRYAVTSNCASDATGAACSWAISSPLGLDLDRSGTLEAAEKLSYANDVAFPPGPTGKPLGDVYVAVTGAPETQALAPVPDALGHVFLTQDRGASWTALHGNGTSDLPNVPIHVASYDPTDATNQTLLVGTDLGVYRTTDGGQTWSRFGVGLPFVSVTGMHWSKSGGILRISTYGRGLWEIQPGAVAHATPGNLDYDRNGRLDFFDLAALASRMGQTPASGGEPAYDWNLDTSAAGTIGDADLAALGARFGNQP